MRRKGRGEKAKSPVWKTILAVVIIIWAIGSVFKSCGSDEPETIQEEPAPVVDIVEEEPVQEEEMETEPEREEEPAPPAEDQSGIELVAGEKGEYGEPYTVNKGTEFEENYIVYRVPAGTYTVTNTGDYMSQFNVCSEELRVTDAGWEEPAETFYCIPLDVGQSDTVKIEEGQIIEIHEPDKFTLKETAEPVMEKEPEPESEEQPEIEIQVEPHPTTAETPEPTPTVTEQLQVIETTQVETPAAEPTITTPVAVTDPLSLGYVSKDYAMSNDPLSDDTTTTYQEPTYQEPVQTGNDYVMNANSGIFHYDSCDSVSRMSEKNKRYHTGTREEVLAMGYTPCQNCNP